MPFIPRYWKMWEVCTLGLHLVDLSANVTFASFGRLAVGYQASRFFDR